MTQQTFPTFNQEGTNLCYNTPSIPMALRLNAGHGLLMLIDPVQRRTTVGRTPLNKLSAHRRYLYLTTQNTHKRQNSIPPAGFDRTIPVKERPKDHTLDPATTEVGIHLIYSTVIAYGLFKESVSILDKNLE